MDKKSIEEEAKPKITRSIARHLRRKRLLSAKRAAKNDATSVLTNIESERSEDSKIAENRRVEEEESLSKSKARRLRKRKKTESIKSLEKNCQDKTVIVDSPLRQRKASIEIVADSSKKSTSETVFSDVKNEIIGTNAKAKLQIADKVTASEHELFENEKYCRTSDNSESSIRERRFHAALFKAIDHVFRPPVEETLIIRQTKISSLSEPVSIRETEISSIEDKPSIAREVKFSTGNEREAVGSRDDVESSNLTEKETSACATKSDKNIGRMNSQEKTREQVKAEREAKKAAKAAAKSKVREITGQEAEGETIVESCKIRKTRGDSVDGEIISEFEKLTTSSTRTIMPDIAELRNAVKSDSQLRAERRAKQEAQRAAKQAQVTEKSRPKVANFNEEMKSGTATATKKMEEITVQEAKAETIVKRCKIREPRGDVVDGEIVQDFKKLATSSTRMPIPDIVESKNAVKTNSELRAERRAKQEAQRAAKQAQATEKTRPKVANLNETIKSGTTTIPKKIEDAGKKLEDSVKKIEDSAKRVTKRVVVKENVHEVNLFKHLYHEREQALVKVPTVNSNIHPAIVRLGVQYADKVIVGSNARCVALLAAVKQLVEDFERPPQADFSRGLEASLQESSAYLHHCRPLAVSMQNALRHLKWQMAHLSETTSDEEAKTKLGNAIDTYIQEQIQLADKAISITIQTKISNGDVILTYGYSSLIHKILCDAHDAGRQFRVVVVDGRPWLEGRELLRRLAKHGLECSYVLINALSFIMPEVSKVFLGAHAILANGAVMSRVGTAQVALMAKSFNVPVLVACETHKTCERVQTDSIVYNEIGDADELARNPMGIKKKTSLINWRGKKSLNLLNITYDVTPADLVTAVVTELAILPCTSVPVILRIKPSEI